MKSIFVFALIFCGLISNVYASGNRVGNGGNVVSCPNKIQVLDLYESSQKLAEYPVGSAHAEIIRLVLKNLEKASPSLAKQYRRRADEFLKETDLRADVQLVAIDDSKHLFAPTSKDCKVQQIAIRKNIAGSGSRFLINKNLWDKLPEIEKAALIMHEIIYEHFFKLGEEDSVKARSVNAYLFSEAFQTDKKDKFWKIVQDMKTPIYQ